MKYAHIWKGRVLGIWEADVLPEVDESTHLVVLGEDVDVEVGWIYVSDTEFKPPTYSDVGTEVTLVALKSQAMQDLQLTDRVFRRILEATLVGIEVDKQSIVAWRQFSQALRTILSANSVEEITYPTRPDYPQHT